MKTSMGLPQAISALSLIILICGTSTPLLADYITPGLGSNYTMDSLVTVSGGAVTGGSGQYQVNESVVVSLGDELNIAPGQTLTFMDSTGNIGLEIHGSLLAVGTDIQPILLTGNFSTPGSWRGLDFNNGNAGSEFHLVEVEIAYADIALDILGVDLLVENCRIHHSLDKAIDITDADGLFTGCHLHHNEQRTVSINLTSSPTFEDCIFNDNNLENRSAPK